MSVEQVMQLFDVAARFQTSYAESRMAFWLEMRDELLGRIRNEAKTNPGVVAEAARQWAAIVGTDPWKHD